MVARKRAYPHGRACSVLTGVEPARHCRNFIPVAHRPRRHGKVLVLVLVSLFAIIGTMGLVLDAALMTSDLQIQKHATDAAAMAGAMDLLLGKSNSHATATSRSYLQDFNDVSPTQATMVTPPTTGPYAGRQGFLEVSITASYFTRLMHILGAPSQQDLITRSVAGREPSTVGAAVVVLDRNPPPTAIEGIPLILPSLPELIAGLEVLGVGPVRVDGAVLINTEWGGVDENGNPAGDGAGPPYGLSCTPLVPLTSLHAQDIRVAGGVDNPDNYQAFAANGDNPLRANRLPVPDPFEGLPVPTTGADPTNVSATLRGTAQVVALPLVPPTVLQPGVYEWIEIISGTVIFTPGVYIVRNVNPGTGIALNITGGSVTAQGVLFYMTNSPAYDAKNGLPDATDGETVPPVLGPTQLEPSAVINAAILTSRFSPLADAESPFDGMLIYQRRHDRRPIIVAHQNLALGGAVTGTLYSKWSHIVLTGTGTFDLRIVSGTARLITALGMTIAPSRPLPPAEDVYLVE